MESLFIHTTVWYPRKKQHVYQHADLFQDKNKYELKFSGIVEYETLNFKEEAFSIFNGVKSITETNMWWSTPMHPGCILYINHPLIDSTDICLDTGWQTVLWKNL